MQLHPVSHQQKKQFLLSLLQENTPFNAQKVRVLETFSRQAFEGALQKLVHRHESLRTRFLLVDGEVKQRIMPYVPLPVEYIDLRAATEVPVKVKSLARAERKSPFDLEWGPLFRVKLVQFGNGACACLFTVHPIVSDAASVQILERELWALYEGCLRGTEAALPPLERQNKEFAAWQRQELSGEKGKAHREYWLNELKYYFPKPSLSTRYGYTTQIWNRRITPSTSYRALLNRELDGTARRVPMLRTSLFGAIDTINQAPGACHHFSVGSFVYERIRDLAETTHTSLQTVLLTSFHLLVGKLTGETNNLIGCPVNLRSGEAFAGTTGLLTGDLMCRCQLKEKTTVYDCIAQVDRRYQKACQHQAYPLEKIMDDLNVPLESLVPFYLNLVRANDDEKQHAGFRPAHALCTASRFDLDVLVVEHRNGLNFHCRYKAGLFPLENIAFIFREYAGLLEEMALNPGQSIIRPRANDRPAERVAPRVLAAEPLMALAG